MYDLGKLLKNLREAKNVSMDKMCDDFKQKYNVSIAKSTISKWENNKAEPSMSNARILADYFGVTLDYILGLEKVDDKIKKIAEDNKIKQIAAHFEGENFSEEDVEDIHNFIEYVISKRKK